MSLNHDKKTAERTTRSAPTWFTMLAVASIASPSLEWDSRRYGKRNATRLGAPSSAVAA
jgi:hypothetical protein